MLLHLVGLVGPRRDVRKDRDPRRMERRALQRLAQRLQEGLHETGVEGRADVQRGVGGPDVRKQGLRPRDVLGRPREDHLDRRVVVGHVDGVQPVGLQDFEDLPFVASENRRHAPAGGSAHQLSSPLHQPQPRLEVEHLRRQEGVVLPQAVAGDEIGRLRAAVATAPIAQRVHHVQGGLRVLRLVKPPLRIFQTELRHRIAEDPVGRGHHLGIALEEPFAHADDLGALAGKDTGFHDAPLRRAAVTAGPRRAGRPAPPREARAKR